VQTTIANVWRKPEESEKEPIRVTVADRSQLPQTIARIDAQGRTSLTPRGDLAFAQKTLGDARVELGYGDTPLPPRRPPSEAFTSHEPLPPLAYSQLISGAQPIVAHTQFVARSSATPQ
jgi:hypothetical protein